MPKQDPVIRFRAGSSLVEILVVLLLVSLAAAALMTNARGTMKNLEPKHLESDPSVGEAGELARILQLWTSDPQQLETLDLDLEAALDEDAMLDTEAEREAYRDFVDELEASGRQDAWRDFLRRRFGEERLREGRLGEGRLGEGRLEEKPQTDPFADDPDIRWVD